MQACFVDIVFLSILLNLFNLQLLSDFLWIFSPLNFLSGFPPFIVCFLFLTIMNNSISSICLTETYEHEKMYLYKWHYPNEGICRKPYVLSHTVLIHVSMKMIKRLALGYYLIEKLKKWIFLEKGDQVETIKKSL